MQDSNIVFKVTTVGVEEATAKMNTLGATITKLTYNANGTVTASGKLSSTLNEQTNSTDKVAQATNRASKAQESYLFHIGKTTVLSALVNKLFLGMVDAAGQAVKQVDLFTNFPASMQALGLSSKDASASLLLLRNYAAQTGISLSEATTTVARFAEVTKNVKAATAEFVGVKNALIAGGAGAEVQKNALEQLIQSYSRGKPQLIEWRSLMVAMPAQLNQVAKAMKLPNAQALGESLTQGKVSMQDFVTELTKLSTGTGPIAAQALARMQGIEFASNVMKNALVNGLAAIYQAIGRQTIIGFFSFLTQVIKVLSGWVVTLINDLRTLFNFISGIFGGPQIPALAKDVAEATGTGAANASDMADGLGDAADNAAKINKSLASFDKMNVLPDKTSSGSGKDNSGAGGTGPLDAATAGLLGDIFDGLGGKLQEASKFAKIFAGILAGLFTNAAIAKLFGINPLKDLIGGIKDATKGFLGMESAAAKAARKAKEAADAANTGESAGKSFGTKFGEGVGKSLKALPTILAGAAGGIVTAISTSVAPAIGAGLIAVGEAVAIGAAAVVAFVTSAIGLIIIAAVLAIIGIFYLIYRNWDTIWGLIKNVFDAVWGAIVDTWNTLFDIFAAPIEWLINFVKSAAILIIAGFVYLQLAIIKIFVDLVTGLYNLLITVATWVYNNVILPVVNFFIGMWQSIINVAIAAWQFIFNNILLPVVTWVNTNLIQPVLNLFKSLWSTVSGFVSGFVTGTYSFLSPLVNWISANIIGPIGNLFSGLWNGVKTGVSDMIKAIESIMGSLGAIIKAPINAVIDSFNKIIGSLNKIKIPGTNIAPSFGPIPRLAKGGIIDQATMALVGENGREAVVPLENNTEWIDTLATKLNKGTNGGQPIQLIVQIGEDKVASKIIDLINEKTNMSGRNAIYV